MDLEKPSNSGQAVGAAGAHRNAEDVSSCLHMVMNGHCSFGRARDEPRHPKNHGLMYMMYVCTNNIVDTLVQMLSR